MTSTSTALGLLFASLALTASPALAQQPPAAAAPAAPQYSISKDAQAEVIALKTAVEAKDVATIPAKLAAAQAKAKTKEDRYVIARLELKAAADAKNSAGMMRALEAVSASGVATPAQITNLYTDVGAQLYEAKDYAGAASAYEKVTALAPNDIQATVLLAEARNGQGRKAEAVALIQKAIAARKAAGQKAEENWYKRAVALSYEGKLPTTPSLAREWASAYPSATAWRDTIKLTQQSGNFGEEATLDIMRLMHTAGAIEGDADHFNFAQKLVVKGYPGEAKAVLEQGFAANKISKSNASFAALYKEATTKSQGDRASLAASAKSAVAGAAAKPVLNTADAYYGYGDFAEAATLYRAALTKSGVDKNIANLRLGMALARSGDKAGANAAFSAVTGQQGEVAKLWMAYMATQA
ncbi:tetratricopeptide repeat protein [Sphingomonas sp. LY29]|uniref:tetratricopeptide repeat protein n=1 Tax=Sphingomonas sp. LY29 TaxID=3095341 RepID=UPI002D793753|nr:tetratricopeptide repeat protein [Sphingomonas sp. LY29]WRP26091.1 tetratricopeptide repeat protein [Sphingomonas sp. LY29]